MPWDENDHWVEPDDDLYDEDEEEDDEESSGVVTSVIANYLHSETNPSFTALDDSGLPANQTSQPWVSGHANWVSSGNNWVTAGNDTPHPYVASPLVSQTAEVGFSTEVLGANTMPNAAREWRFPIEVALLLADLAPGSITVRARTSGGGEVFYPDYPEGPWAAYRQRALTQFRGVPDVEKGMRCQVTRSGSTSAQRRPKLEFVNDAMHKYYADAGYDYKPPTVVSFRAATRGFSESMELVMGPSISGLEASFVGSYPYDTYPYCQECASEDPNMAYLRCISADGSVRFMCSNCIAGAKINGLWKKCDQCGKHWRTEPLIGDSGSGTVTQYWCQDCFPSCLHCDRGLWAEEHLYGREDSAYFCLDCFHERYSDCQRCHKYFIRDMSLTLHYDQHWYCAPCYARVTRDGARIGRSATPVTSVTHQIASRWAPSFGVEIEAHFNTEEVRIGDYHEGREAGKPFFSRWRAERDSSIFNGGEIVSPVLRGVEGVGEVLATMGTLRELEASVTGACGQHIHIGDPPSISKIQAVLGCLEDFGIGITGSFRRWGVVDYAPRIKNNPQSMHTASRNHLGGVAQSDEPIVYGRCIAYITPLGTIEYRYPPGTLNGTQYVLNHGFTHLVTELATHTAPGDINEWAKVWAEIGRRAVQANPAAANGGLVSGGPWVHESMMEAAKFIRDVGNWKIGGDWKGLPFHHISDGGKKIIVTDTARQIEKEVKLPTETDLIKRITRQMTNFYVSAHRISGWWSEEDGRKKADEVVEVFA